MKQTAVEWLVEEIECRGIVTKELRLAFQQAKAMEKQQLMEAFTDELNYNFEQYYNETFKSE